MAAVVPAAAPLFVVAAVTAARSLVVVVSVMHREVIGHLNLSRTLMTNRRWGASERSVIVRFEEGVKSICARRDGRGDLQRNLIRAA